MKKLLIYVFILCIVSIKGFSQAFQPENNMWSLGAGLGGKLGKYDFKTQTPTYNLQFERGIWKIDEVGTISTGGYLGYKGYKSESNTNDLYSYKENWSYWIIGARAAFHLNAIKNEKLDLYGGENGFLQLSCIFLLR